MYEFVVFYRVLAAGYPVMSGQRVLATSWQEAARETYWRNRGRRVRRRVRIFSVLRGWRFPHPVFTSTPFPHAAGCRVKVDDVLFQWHDHPEETGYSFEVRAADGSPLYLGESEGEACKATEVRREAARS